jgi:hypothetical protein
MVKVVQEVAILLVWEFPNVVGFGVGAGDGK